jgi:hypothetical protein
VVVKEKDHISSSWSSQSSAIKTLTTTGSLIMSTAYAFTELHGFQSVLILISPLGLLQSLVQ